MDKRPMPTDYAGVRFRSKSEAVLARMLDIVRERMKKTHIAWAYEPEIVKTDFAVFITIPDENRVQMIAIEYKPSRPSDAYIERWRELMAPYEKNGWLPVIWYGNGWTKEYRQIHMDGRERDHWSGYEHWMPEAMRHRFDLAA